MRFPLVQPTTNFDFFVLMWEVQSPYGLTTGDDVAIGIFSAITNIAMQFAFGGFSEVSGLSGTMETEDYVEGGNYSSPRKFVKHGTYPDLVFKRGVTFDPSLSDWYYQAKTGKRPRVRKSGLIILFDRGTPLSAAGPIPGIAKIPVAAWYFHRAFPKRIDGPTLQAKGNEIAIETLVLHHEGIDRLSPAMIPGIGEMFTVMGV
jgi:phage tail-like protein